MASNQTITLLRQIQRAATPQEVVDCAFTLLGNPIFYQSITGSISYYTKKYEIKHLRWQKDIVEGSLSMNSLMPKGGFTIADHVKKYRETDTPIRIDSHHADNEFYQNIIVPIFIQNETMGILVISDFERPFCDEDDELFHLVADIFTAKLTQVCRMHPHGRHVIEGVFFRLLDGSTVDPELLKERIQQIGWKPKKYFHVLTIQSDSQNPEHMLDLFILTRHSCNQLFFYQNRIIYLYTSDELSVSWEDEHVGILSWLQTQQLQGAVSNSFTDLLQLRRYYIQSVKALNISAELQLKAPIVNFDSLLIYMLIDHWSKSFDPEDLCCDHVRILQDYDKNMGADLLGTLRVYLESHQDIALTANRLFLHKNTVRYRISRCRKLLNTEFGGPLELFNLYLSLCTLDYIKNKHKGVDAQ